MEMKPLLDALPLEYKLNKRSTFRNLNIPDGLHNPIIKGKVSILCRNIPEKSFDIFTFQNSLFSDYTAGDI